MNFKVGMISLGCPKNQVDAEIMLKKLIDNNFTIVTNTEDADIVIINTCGFIEDAKKEAIEAILETAEYKKAGLISGIVVTGCLAERYQDEILEEIPEVDAVVGIGANSDIVKICQKVMRGIVTSLYPDKCYLPIDDERLVSTPSHWAYLKIADGCDNKCSYCAIPYIRGKFRSRTIESIVKEANKLVSDGVKELILIAQDTTRYGFDIYGRNALADLLKELVKIDDLKWIRLYYCYPDRLTDDVIDLIANEEKICNYIDIPLQHCNEKVLKSMNRFGSYNSLCELIDKLRKKIPNISLRTTFMVGFPDETDEDFEELCNFVNYCKFDKLGVFEFSPEEDTPAFDFENQIEDSVKQSRAQTVMDIQYSITEESNNNRVGSVFEVVIDSKDGENYLGRSYMDAPEIDASIIVQSDTELEIGNFYNVKIISYDGYDLIGRVI